MNSYEELQAKLASMSPDRKRQLLARMRAEKEGRRTLWECANTLCTGAPHADAPTKHARPEQRLPFKRDDGLLGVLAMAGRGWGKTRFGAEGVRKRVNKGLARRVALLARTPADARDVMIEGESGLLSCFPKWERPDYQPSKRRIVFANGAAAYVYSAQESDQLRGPQHDLLWADEVSTFPKMLDVRVETGKPSPEGVLTNAFLGLRLPVVGDAPRAILTGTPRPSRDMKYLVEHMITQQHLFKLVSGTTYDNLANLADVFKKVILDQYEGTRVGQQELMGLLLRDVEGALLRWEHFEYDEFRQFKPATDVTTMVVAVDPAVKSETKSDFTGVVVFGADADRRHGYVFHSERIKASPAEAMLRVATLYDMFQANYVVGEVNNGGDYVKTVLHQHRDDIPFKNVHASVGKRTRAEPIAYLYEQRRIHHIGGPHQHAALEDEWTSWIPDEPEADSPDVLDACVWGATNLMTSSSAQVVGRPYTVGGKKDAAVSPRQMGRRR